MSDSSLKRCSSPTSTTSGNLSGDSLPSNLANEELQLALNKEATEDELLKAINHCKELVLDSDQCSKERKWLVRHLIELRLRYQECKEALADPQHPRNKTSGVSKRTIKGHHLNLQPLLRGTTSRYCDHCTGTIWSVIQAWYECEDCGYSCHHKCLGDIIRECAHVVATERGTYEFDICPEIGLSAQKYLCAECAVPLLVSKDWSEARRCDYSGLYYCSACHWGSSAIIPARVTHNWDFSPYPVSQSSLQQLRVTAKRPLINLDKLNPRLFYLVHELNLVKRLRQEICGMKKYLTVCRKATEDHLLWRNFENSHLIDTIDLYSLQDLADIESGELLTKLHEIVNSFSNHIKKECEICMGRGHICEICSNEQVIYPFESSNYICENCKSVYHKSCYERKNTCFKCLRLKTREVNQEENSED